MCYEKLDRDRELVLDEEIESKRAEDQRRMQSRRPVLCEVLTLNDIAIAAGGGESSADWEADVFCCTVTLKYWLLRKVHGWITPRILAEAARSVREEAKDIPLELLDRIALYCEALDPAVLILLDDEPLNGVTFRGYFSNVLRTGACDRSPRASTLLRSFLEKNGNSPVRPVHELILPNGQELWAAVVFGPIHEGDGVGGMRKQSLVEYEVACHDFCYHDVTHRDPIEVFVWRFNSRQAYRRFVEKARREVDALIEAAADGEPESSLTSAQQPAPSI